MAPNNGMQRTAPRAAADAEERWAIRMPSNRSRNPSVRRSNCGCEPLVSDQAKSWIYLNVPALETDVGTIYTVNLKTKSVDSCLASKDEGCLVTIWDTRGSCIGVTPQEKLRSKLRDQVDDYMTEFLNDYLTPNPRFQ